MSEELSELGSSEQEWRYIPSLQPDGWLYFALRRSNKGTGVEMCPAVVSGIVPRDTLVSYWPIVFLVTSNSPRRLWESYLGLVSSSIVQS